MLFQNLQGVLSSGVAGVIAAALAGLLLFRFLFNGTLAG
jgi:hypothetical protein